MDTFSQGFALLTYNSISLVACLVRIITQSFWALFSSTPTEFMYIPLCNTISNIKLHVWHFPVFGIEVETDALPCKFRIHSKYWKLRNGKFRDWTFSQAARKNILRKLITERFQNFLFSPLFCYVCILLPPRYPCWCLIFVKFQIFRANQGQLNHVMVGI